MNETVTLRGHIIDNVCANEHRSSLSGFVATHTKECVLKPSCAKSGYSLYTETGSIIPLEKTSYAAVGRFLRKRNSTLKVEVAGEKCDGHLRLLSIKNG